MPLVVQSTDRAVVLHTCGKFAYRELLGKCWYGRIKVGLKKYPYTQYKSQVWVSLWSSFTERESHDTHVTRLTSRRVSDIGSVRTNRSRSDLREPRERVRVPSETEYRDTTPETV